MITPSFRINICINICMCMHIYVYMYDVPGYMCVCVCVRIYMCSAQDWGHTKIFKVQLFPSRNYLVVGEGKHVCKSCKVIAYIVKRNGV